MKCPKCGSVNLDAKTLATEYWTQNSYEGGKHFDWENYESQKEGSGYDIVCNDCQHTWWAEDIWEK